MNIRHILLAITALSAFIAAPARATDSHDYTKGEYAIIRDGLAPDKRLSLAAHGDGDGGNDNFHVWLMAEPAHRRIAALDGIGSANNLDSGPGAYYGSWSADSRHVAVSFRSGRHVAELNLYRIENRRPRLVSGPSLFKDLSSRDVTERDDMRRSIPQIEWKSPRRFVLKERRVFVTSDPAFRRLLGWYGRVMEEAGEGRQIVEFSAEADCVLMPDNRYRIVDLRVGKFGDAGSF
jgi:hypothetical protein